MQYVIYNSDLQNTRFFYAFDDNGQYWPVDEQVFFIAKGLGFGYQEILGMPVKTLRWYVERLIRHIDDENKALKSAQKGR